MDLAAGTDQQQQQDSALSPEPPAPTSSSGSGSSPRIDGYLYKLEQRPIVGQLRKKYWFVLPSNSPVLYWYKNATDFNCSGRILLSGAAFMYNPREHGIFEIHVDNKCYLLEAPSNRARLDWLSCLQQSRRLYYQRGEQQNGGQETKSPVTAVETRRSEEDDEIESSPSTTSSASKSREIIDAENGENYSRFHTAGPRRSQPMGFDGLPQSFDELEETDEPRSSVFYLREDGELHPGSLEVPPAIHTMCDGGMEQLLKLDELLMGGRGTTGDEGQQQQQQAEMVTSRRLLDRARNSFRTLSKRGSHPMPVNPPPRENCDRCQELVNSMDQLRNRCYELTDDLVGYQDLVKSLKRSIVSAYDQRDSVKRYYMEATTDDKKVDFILERESALAKMHFANSELRRDIEALKEENRRLEAENSSLNITVEAYQESVRTKEELIYKYCGSTEKGNTTPPPGSQPVPIVNNAALKMRPSSSVGAINNNTGLGLLGQQNNAMMPFSSPAEATEALLVDFGTPTDIAAKTLFTETAVNDLNEMKDLVDGYRNQNRFLNNEVLELQKIVQSLEERERRLIRQNFNIEAVYYQLKSRYIMLLNHFRPSAADQQQRQTQQQQQKQQQRSPVVEPSLIQELIDEVSRPHSPMRAHNASSLAVETAKSPSALATLVACPQKAIAAYDDTEGLGGILHHRSDAPDTDSLGFYLSSPRTRKTVADFFRNGTGKDAEGGEEEVKKGEEDGEQKQLQNSLSDDGIPTTSTARSKTPLLLSTSTQTTESHLAEFISGELVSPSTSSSFPSAITPITATCPPAGFPRPSSSGDNVHAPRLVGQDDWLLRLAADMQKRSDDILFSTELGNNQELVEWLQKWDAFLVNHVLQPLSPNPQLKSLVRCGIPHTYRSRVWSSLVNFLVASTQSETGKGYYDCLLRKAHRIQEQSAAGTGKEDAALKQIDLDLVRTLPNNKLFETENSPKVGSLRNVLYAFRFHNRCVEYCQGLNRLGAIGLLYLDEPQAFWFLVACVDHLQPPNYYSPSLLGAVVDQRVLLDLVQDKMPALYAHLQRLELDLSLFTLSWFLTVFVDVLPHNIYIKIFDVFLHEGNKVLFRFALALLKLAEPPILDCCSLSGLQNCLSNLAALVPDFRTLSHIAFNYLNPFPARSIENRRQHYYAQYKSGKFKS